MDKQSAGKQVKKVCQTVGTSLQTAYRHVCPVLTQIWSVIYNSRKLLLSIPVICLAVYLARLNQQMLPQTVGLVLLKDGNFKYMIPQAKAIYYPLALTGGCLLMMYCSRRTLYPWLISLFTMVVPLLILVTNLYPA